MKKTTTFAITRNHLDNIFLSPVEVTALHKEGYTEYFKIFDDDGILYFSGYLHKDEDGEGCFKPLDWAMWDSGCTYIKYRNKKTGKMEIT